MQYNKIHITLDQGPYNKSQETKRAAKKYNRHVA